MMDFFCFGSKYREERTVLGSNMIVSKLSYNVKHHKELPEHHHHRHIQAKLNILSHPPL